ncbi:MAG: type II secretion system protein [Victivallales bacterium]|nr:type II secretion system protein [Victivallales bacterium]
MKRRKNFTLVELLVVIAIIAILASMLFPVLNKARDKAKAISCVSSLKQLTLAFQFYLDDYSRIGPIIYQSSINRGWAFYLMQGKYINNREIFRCPTLTGGYINTAITYGYSCEGSENFANGLGGSGVFRKIKNPSQRALLTDSTRQSTISGALLWHADICYTSNSGFGQNAHLAGRHQNKAGVSHVDGHVKLLSLEELKKLSPKIDKIYLVNGLKN